MLDWVDRDSLALCLLTAGAHVGGTVDRKKEKKKKKTRRDICPSACCGSAKGKRATKRLEGMGHSDIPLCISGRTQAYQPPGFVLGFFSYDLITGGS